VAGWRIGLRGGAPPLWLNARELGCVHASRLVRVPAASGGRHHRF